MNPPRTKSEAISGSTDAIRRSAALTLTELLVVIAIITTLASLLLPALFKSKASAHRTACLFGKGLNLAFLDGGARNYKVPELWQLTWNRKFKPGTPK